jgi:hypothetical protein
MRIETTRSFVGICHMQVCADPDVTDEELLHHCNINNPSGTTGGWSFVVRQGGEKEQKPTQCESDKNKMHFLVGC